MLRIESDPFTEQTVNIMSTKQPDRRIMTIDRDQLEDAKTEDLVRLAEFVGLPIEPDWDHAILARKLFWGINHFNPPGMY